MPDLVVFLVIAALVVTVLLVARHLTAGASGGVTGPMESADLRRRNLHAQWGPQIGEAIYLQRLWLGANAEHVVAMYGHPVAREEKVSARGVRLVFKYQPRHHGSFGVLVTLDDGIVSGWETK